MWGRLVFCLCLVTIVASCSHCTNKSASVSSETSGIKVFFTPSTDCEKNIVKAINNADKMDIAVYSITNPTITDSLIAAHNRSATIRIVTDKTQAK